MQVLKYCPLTQKDFFLSVYVRERGVGVLVVTPLWGKVLCSCSRHWVLFLFMDTLQGRF